MKLAVSNSALPPGDHGHLLSHLPEMGVAALEVVPAQVWEEDPSAAQVAEYRRRAETAGLRIIGLHGLLAGQPGLGLFGDLDARRRTRLHLIRQSEICRDLGGRHLVLESRWLRGRPLSAAWQECRDFLDDLMPAIEPHGTVLCFAPLAPSRGDFCLTATECRILAGAVDHFSFGHALALTAMCENDEMVHAPFAGVRGKLDHVHLDEPGFVELGSTGKVDHADFRRHLAAISYFDWISVVQRWRGAADPLDSLGRGIRFAIQTYLPIDTR